MIDIRSDSPGPAARLTRSAGFKVFVLGLLSLLLLIPATLVRGLVQERQDRSRQVKRETAHLWGIAQMLLGPVLAIPYRPRIPEPIVTADGTRVLAHRAACEPRCTAYLLPRELDWSGRLEPEVRRRGLYETVVYRARLEASGSFRPAALEKLGIEPQRFDWSRARLVLGITDVRGLEDRIPVRWSDEEVPFEPGTDAAPIVGRGIQSPLPPAAFEALASGNEVAFSFQLALRGSSTLRLLPAGEETTVELSSGWSDPSFVGAFLPRDREVATEGFSGSWSVPHFGRGFPEVWLDDAVADSALHSATFGVELLMPADGYQQTERSVKYALLFFVLTFALLFLLELIAPSVLHAMHYLLVGAALCVFYLLLLALCEHLGFALAYLVSTAAILAMVGGYAHSVLDGRRASAVVAACLGGLYGYLYVILQAQDFALLLGALGLFAVLSLLMFLTRNLDWSTLQFRRSVEERRSLSE